MSKKLKRDVKKMLSTRTSRMTGAGKRFSREEYEETKRAVDVIIDWHEQHDCFVDANHEDPKGPDLIEWIGFRPVKYLEVAQRSAWKEGPWNQKWDPVNIEERKVHLFRLSLPCDYWVVSKDLKQALIIPYDTVLKYINNLEEVSNRAVRAGEKFIRIPLSECDQVCLEQGDNSDIKNI